MYEQNFINEEKQFRNMVNTRKKDGKAEVRDKFDKHSKVKNMKVMAEPGNSKQKAKRLRLKSEQTPNKRKVNQKAKRTPEAKNKRSKKSQKFAEAQFCEDGNTIHMTVGSLPKTFVDQFAEPEDQAHRSNQSPSTSRDDKSSLGTDEYSSGSSSSDNDSWGEESEDEDVSSKPKSTNNNSTKVHANQQNNEEELNYEDVVETVVTPKNMVSDGEVSDSDDSEVEAEMAERASEYLALLKAEKKLKKKKERLSGQLNDQSETWSLVREFCKQEGYELVKPTSSKQKQNNNNNKWKKEENHEGTK